MVLSIVQGARMAADEHQTVDLLRIYRQANQDAAQAREKWAVRVPSYVSCTPW